MSLFPANAPLTPDQINTLTPTLASLTNDQSLWLSGFLAGRASSTAAAPTRKASTPVTLLFGTESGNAETLAAQAQKSLKKSGFKATLLDMADAEPADLVNIENLIVIISTWGDGEPPERAKAFYDALIAESAPKLKKTNFAVCGLGDSSYEQFCEMGKVFDARLKALGGTQIHERMDCDVDFEEPFDAWFKDVSAKLEKANPQSAPQVTLAEAAPSLSNWSKSNPFAAELIERINLNGTGSAKETVHLEFSLEGSDIQYEPGDALGLKPHNCPEYVQALLQATKLDGETPLEGGTLREVLTQKYDITALSKKVAQAYAEQAKSQKLDKLIANAKTFKQYVEGRHIIDLFEDFPAEITAQTLLTLLRAQPARLYSIASSLKAHPDEVHLTVGAVRYESHSKQRKGVASTYLADRIEVGGTADIYIHTNNNFRLPENPDTPIIMVGPGTGIAPFRAFVEERAAINASGKNWLFFGDQHYHYDFLYQLEWQDHLKEGSLTKLDVAFSRDAPEKYYVQHSMQKNAQELWQWLEAGAHFYVCGDASRMAKDVNQALIDIVQEQGKLSDADAKQYVSRMTKDKRYQKDVY